MFWLDTFRKIKLAHAQASCFTDCQFKELILKSVHSLCSEQIFSLENQIFQQQLLLLSLLCSSTHLNQTLNLFESLETHAIDTYRKHFTFSHCFSHSAKSICHSEECHMLFRKFVFICFHQRSLYSLYFRLSKEC